MANSFVILSTRELQLLVGGNELVDGIQVGALTVPSGFYFAFRRPSSGATQAIIDSIADQYSVRYEEVAAGPHVTDLQYVADVSDAGQPMDTVRVYWQTDDGASRGYVTVRQADLGPHKTPPVVAAAVAAAQAITGDVTSQLNALLGL